MDARTYNIVGTAGVVIIGFAIAYAATGNATWPIVTTLSGEVGDALSLFDASAFLKFYAALFAIMNPLVVIPMFVAMTDARPVAHRNQLARATTMTVLVALVVAAVFGREILGFFAISIGAFRIAGGIIVLSMGLAMLKSDGFAGGGEQGEVDGTSRAVCPLAIPLLAGPGAIATIIVQCEGAARACDYVTLGSVIAAMVFTTWLTLRAAAPVARFLGRTGLTITTRLMGMIVSAIAIDMGIIGAKLLFPSFA
jgi:multiple antibiotic resistance protein